MQKGISTLVIIIIVIVVLIIGGGTSYLWLRNVQKPIVCTQEVKTCPDGSTVGRIGPNCEFAECPDVTAGWKTYRNTKYGYEIKYPESAVLSTWIPGGGEIKSVSDFPSNAETIGITQGYAYISICSSAGCGPDGVGIGAVKNDESIILDGKIYQASGWLYNNNEDTSKIMYIHLPNLSIRYGYWSYYNQPLSQKQIKIADENNNKVFSTFKFINQTNPAYMTRQFVCDNNKSITADYYETGNKRYVNLKFSDGRKLQLSNVSSASGDKYSNISGNIIFWSKGAMAGECTAYVLETLENKVTQTYTNCKCEN